MIRYVFVHKALEGTAALLRDELEAKEGAVSGLEKKLSIADVHFILNLQMPTNLTWTNAITNTCNKQKP